MSGDGTWIAHLKCGHDRHVQGEPRLPGWITCVAGHCQGQRRIVRVSLARRHLVPVPGETGIQEPLWEAA
jgi:hypothetical protein